ncbi:hypothetical protein EZI54_01955 [Marinobacter halodurans]|uniref:Uncharacterized protein n=1 Tax=Marinobacter halodurans TaxID=2528979 RepID=A0ABY1ZQ81_9GAMM|nr:hypothetical protein [Marinobacter halodurans]TBW59099.1 hypothetical protein EZI54_01955 [Marinobacter halodurans]
MLRIPVCAFLLVALPGCASYQSHYGVFSAANASGEERQFRVTWETVDYPDWWLANDRASPIRLETQCSTRVWELRDSTSEGGVQPCGEGIRACASTTSDRAVPSQQVAGPETTCMEVLNARKIVELDRRLDLVVSCRPRQTTIEVDGETENRDYLRASVVPYNIRVREAPRDSLSAKPPALDEKVCGS